MFLIRWCMHAISCRRNMTLETMPLSPTKYNGMAVDSDVHQQLGYDGTAIRRALIDEGDPVDPPCFFQERSNTVVGEYSAGLGSCPSESRDSCDVTTTAYLHPAIPSHLSDSLSTDSVATSGQNGNCACLYATTATLNNENTFPNLTTVADNSNSTGLSITQLQEETKHETKCLGRYNLHANNENSAASYNSSLFDYTADYMSGVSQRNDVDLFPANVSRDLLATTAKSLVESTIKAAVRVLNDNDTVQVTSELESTLETVPLSSISNSSLLPPVIDDEQEISSAEAVANQLIDQVLSEIIRVNGMSIFTFSEVPSDETLTCTANSFAVDSHYKVTFADDALKSGSCLSAPVSMPAAADEFLSTSSITISSCPLDDHQQVLANYEDVGLSSDCQLVDVLDGELEYMSSSLSGGRLTFDPDTSPPASRDSNSPDDVTDTLNNNSATAEQFGGGCDDKGADDSESHRHPSDSDALMEMVCSWSPAERDSNLPSGNNDDNPTEISGDLILSTGEDNAVELQPSAKQIPLNADEEKWNFFELGCRTEDYFFRRYVIPVDQLEEEKVSSDEIVTGMMTDADEFRSKLQLYLKTGEETCASGTDVDAEVEAMAAFCRAMFTPISDDLDELLSPPSTQEVVSSPETPDMSAVGGRPPVVRRCISLRTSPGVPHKKKSVRFADALGLDLEYVRQIQTVNDSATAGDFDDFLPRRPPLALAAASWRQPRSPNRRYICACFQAPGGHPDFMERVRESRVVFESYLIDNRSSTIDGIVRVANVAYRKTVAARVTTDGWASQTDIVADYVPRSNDGTTDRFTFQIMLPHGATDISRRVELAVYFTAFFEHRSETYWDNNFAANYCFECYGDSANDDDEETGSSAEMDDEFLAWMRLA